MGRDESPMADGVIVKLLRSHFLRRALLVICFAFKCLQKLNRCAFI
jgi:hypothetical protein